MESKNFAHVQNLSSTTNHSLVSNTTTTTAPKSFVLSPTINTTVETPTRQTIQTASQFESTSVNSDNNNINKESNLLLNHPTFTIKEEQSDDNNYLEPEYSIITNQLPIKQSKINNTIQGTEGNTRGHLNSRESIHGLATNSMSMANIDGHRISTLNQTHLTDNGGSYFVSGLPSDIASNYKLARSSNSDLPSPSTSSNSSNPSSSNHHHHQHHQGKRHDDGGADPTRKRAVRLQKNRDAARECRRKKKEYIKCLEERVTGLETQNKALIEELRQLKELYCQREETNNNKISTSTR
ncbi:unnamed protein product [Adineta steineri]|uniref:BZIP domain-containing protein n=1 Tax=Adineta steineri TaxID=433720 RepID=A0A819FFC7_9BILA|nr:unnamed protein product [Adineta steineri]